MFFVGAPVAGLIVVLTLLAPESEAWQQNRPASMGQIRDALLQHKRIFLYLLLMMSMLLCLSHGAQDLYPDFLKSVPAIAAKTILGMNALYGIPILYNIGAIAGAVFFGHLSQRIGRRNSSMLALAIALVFIPAWAFGATLLVLVVGSFMMQVGVQGAFGVIPAHLNELSPNAVRSLFPGLAYQLGVLLASPATVVEFMLRDRFGYPWALTMFEADDRPDDRDFLVWPGGTRPQFPACNRYWLQQKLNAVFGVAQENPVNEKRIGIIMNGVTGRMGLNQHLVRSILAIRKQGGVELSDGSRLIPIRSWWDGTGQAGADRQRPWSRTLDHGFVSGSS